MTFSISSLSISVYKNTRDSMSQVWMLLFCYFGSHVFEEAFLVCLARCGCTLRHCLIPFQTFGYALSLNNSTAVRIVYEAKLLCLSQRLQG